MHSSLHPLSAPCLRDLVCSYAVAQFSSVLSYLRILPLEVLLDFFIDTSLRRQVNIRHFFTTFNLLDRSMRRDVKRIQSPRERKNVIV